MKRSNISLLLVVFFAVSLFSANAFALPDDSVLSQNIKEADGTSGQDTNTGSGVKTGHIQDGAVTSGKIVDGSITTNKIGDGAVTDAKISGIISRSKIEKYAKVAVVAQNGGDYTNPVTAMNNISTWCGTPSAINTCFLKIMPGVYSISQSLIMQPFVDIEGSGENVTKITATGIVSDNTAYCGGGGVVTGAPNTEIRSLTIESIGLDLGYPNIALWTCRAGWSNPDYNQKITNVTAIAYGGTYNYTIFSNISSPLLTNVKAKATGTGYDVVNLTSYTVMRDVTLITGRVLNADEYGWSTVVKCVDVYDGNYNPVQCP